MLDRHPVETDRQTYLRRLLALELVELDELAEAFRDKALVDRDVASGALLTKTTNTVRPCAYEPGSGARGRGRFRPGA
jgi:hypothetical protein